MHLKLGSSLGNNGGILWYFDVCAENIFKVILFAAFWQISSKFEHFQEKFRSVGIVYINFYSEVLQSHSGSTQ